MLSETNCNICEVRFLARDVDLKRGHAKYCSRDCFGKSIAEKAKAKQVPNTTCAGCNNVFYRIPSKIGKTSRSGLQFCTRLCKDLSQRLGGVKEIQPAHYGTLETTKEYRSVAFRHYPKSCMACGYDRVTEVLEVHHKDKDRSNNRLENLEILCPTCHQEFHFRDKSGRFG